MKYYRTWTEAGQQTHLEGLSDFTLCGLDAVGDKDIHKKDPIILDDNKKHHVTCEHCLNIIDIVKGHLKNV